VLTVTNEPERSIARKASTRQGTSHEAERSPPRPKRLAQEASCHRDKSVRTFGDSHGILARRVAVPPGDCSPCHRPWGIMGSASMSRVRFRGGSTALTPGLS
jgi:hypothetical protein